MILKLTFPFLFFIAAFSTSAQNLHLDQVDQYVSLLESNNRAIGSLAISKNGKEIYNRDFGQAAIPELVPDQQTKYQIGSITKTYTAVLIFQLVEKGKLSLDDKLEKFFPDMPGAAEITISQMLNHKSGLGDYVAKKGKSGWLDKKVSEEQILAEIKRQGLIFKPGEKQQYSNSAYYLLALIAEKGFEKNYGVLVREQICEPLGLKNTASVLTNPDNIYPSYSYQQNGKWTTAKDFYFPNTKGAGDIVATPEDLLQFIDALFNFKLLTEESVELMKPLVEKKEYFGKGLMQIPLRTHLLLGHGGDTHGTHSVLGYNEKDSVSLVLVINGERYTRNQMILGVLSLMYEEPFELPSFEAIEVSAAELERYSGTYTTPKLPVKLLVSPKKGTLYVQASGQRAMPFKAYAKNKFQFEQAGIQIEFLPDGNTLIFNQSGNVFEMKKE